MAKGKVLVINPNDNVAIALQTLPAGETVVVEGVSAPVVTLEAVPVSHKVAIADIPSGKPVIKYGELIGIAARDIGAGEWVHTHNIDGDAPVTSYAEYMAGLTAERQ
jgi:altronate dehydratase